jgi:hypothetical protein
MGRVTDDDPIDLGAALGAEPDESIEALVIYVPNKDRDGVEFGNQRHWVLEAARLLTRIGGGVTIEPAVEGGWFNEETKSIVWENPIKVLCYVQADLFIAHLTELREFVHRLGRETRQGEVAVEFSGRFYRIRRFDR